MQSTAGMALAEPQQIERLLEAAQRTVSAVRYCWVATRGEASGANARAVRSFSGAPGSDAWTRRFLTRRGSRKVAEIRCDPRVTLAYQASSDDAFVALFGAAHLVDDQAEMRALWQSGVTTPLDAFADANMIVVRVEVDQIEIHVRGITAEPFGHRRSLLERKAGSAWRVV